MTKKFTIGLLLILSSLFILGMFSMGKLFYESYYDTISNNFDVSSEIIVSSSIVGQKKIDNRFISIFKDNYSASISIECNSNKKQQIRIKNIMFMDIEEKCLYEIKDIKSVYNSSLKKFIINQDYFISTDMYLNFYFENLVLPNNFSIKIIFSNDNLEESTTIMNLKKRNRLFFNII